MRRLIVLAALVASALGVAHAANRSSRPASMHSGRGEEMTVFAGGCFWGIEALFEHVDGVTSVVSGYAGGRMASPTYEQVSLGTTGHAESVRITFDPGVVSFATLLEVFFSVAHDPTELNRQGPDIGTQYRSAIFYVTDEQRRLAESYIAHLAEVKTFSGPVVTQIVPFEAFFAAEEYHQGYLARHPRDPYIVRYDLPKLAALKRRFPELYRDR
jgi:peptide-methionine (S)-S-oxide reductase